MKLANTNALCFYIIFVIYDRQTFDLLHGLLHNIWHESQQTKRKISKNVCVQQQKRTSHAHLFAIVHRFWPNAQTICSKCQHLPSILYGCSVYTHTDWMYAVNKMKQWGKTLRHNHKLIFYNVVVPLVAYNYIYY